MTAPKRIQQRRVAGWRKPEGAVAVGRGTRWGNPWVVHEHDARCGEDLEHCDKPINASTREAAVRCFRLAVLHPCIGDPDLPTPFEIRAELAGKDLMCWCPLPEPGQPDHCHAAVLIELANGDRP